MQKKLSKLIYKQDVKNMPTKYPKNGNEQTKTQRKGNFDSKPEKMLACLKMNLTEIKQI